VGEGNQEASLDAGAGDEGEALFECRHQTRRIHRTQKLDWMGIESHCQSARTKGVGTLDYV
jgi:hypothetical protein